MTRPDSFRRLWGMPLLIAMLSLAGLLMALIGNGYWDLLSWGALGTPVLVMLYHSLRSRPPGGRRRSQTLRRS